MLALAGEKDLVVEPRLNLAAIRAALDEAGNGCFETVELPGLKHLFQTCATGSPTEYAQIEETLAPAVLEAIAAWARRHGSLAAQVG